MPLDTIVGAAIGGAVMVAVPFTAYVRRVEDRLQNIENDQDDIKTAIAENRTILLSEHENEFNSDLLTEIHPDTD